MVEHKPKFDKSLSGSTNPKRHHRRRLFAALVMLAVTSAVVAGIAIVVRAMLSQRPAPNAHVRETQELGEVFVTDEQAEQAPSQASEEPEPEAEAEPQDAELTLMMIGDILMHDRVIESGNRGDGSYNYDHLFSHIATDVQAADVAVLNQETVLGGRRWSFSGYPVFNSPQEVGDAEVAVGFDVILKATNHTLDLGYEGVHEELAWWQAAYPQVAVIGAADPDGDGVCPAGGTSAAGAYIVEKDGLKVALLNYTDVLNGNVDPSNDANVVSILSEDGLRADVADARSRGADFVVAFVHWGEEYETVPTERERWWAQVMQDAGVDVVIGGHPHVIQPVEVLGEGNDRMLVMWSVGNFVSTQAGAANMVGGMAKVTFTRDGHGLRVSAYEFIPIITQREPYSTNMSAYKIGDYTDELAAASSVSAIDGGNGSTASWYVDYCSDVLGPSFDLDTLSIHGSL